MVFDCDLYYGYIIKGDLLSAITYIKQFSKKSDLHNRFVSVFEHEQYISCDEKKDKDGNSTGKCTNAQSMKLRTSYSK